MLASSVPVAMKAYLLDIEKTEKEPEKGGFFGSLDPKQTSTLHQLYQRP